MTLHRRNRIPSEYVEQVREHILEDVEKELRPVSTAAALHSILRASFGEAFWISTLKPLIQILPYFIPFMIYSWLASKCYVWTVLLLKPHAAEDQFFTLPKTQQELLTACLGLIYQIIWFCVVFFLPGRQSGSQSDAMGQRGTQTDYSLEGFARLSSKHSIFAIKNKLLFFILSPFITVVLGEAIVSPYVFFSRPFLGTVSVTVIAIAVKYVLSLGGSSRDTTANNSGYRF